MLAHCAIVRCEYSAGSMFCCYVFQNRRKSRTGGKLSRIPRHENGTFFWKEVKIMEAAVTCSITRKNGTKAKKSTSFFRPFCFIITMKGLWIKRVLFPSYWGLSPSCLEVPILLDPAGRLPRDSNMVLSSVGVGSFKNKLSYTFLLNLFLYPSLSLFSFSLTASSSFFTIFFFLLFFDALFLRIIVTLRLPLS